MDMALSLLWRMTGAPDSIPEPFQFFGVPRSMLAVQRLTKHYGALVAVHDVSFEARPGEVLGLLGPNGSGKSTTVKILTGLLRQTSGNVELDGRNALDEPFSGLDVTAARVLKGFVRALADEGKIIVFSSHVLEVVEQVCSRVVILKDGRIVGHDSVANLRATLRLPSLDAVFASLVEEDHVEERTQGLLAAMRA